MKSGSCKKKKIISTALRPKWSGEGPGRWKGPRLRGNSLLLKSLQQHKGSAGYVIHYFTFLTYYILGTLLPPKFVSIFFVKSFNILVLLDPSPLIALPCQSVIWPFWPFWPSWGYSEGKSSNLSLNTSLLLSSWDFRLDTKCGFTAISNDFPIKKVITQPRISN